MKKLPIGIQGFEGLRKDGYLYVDKTEYIYKLCSTGKEYFLSRPRRFGKSLFLSAMKAYWEGKKELFLGLRLEELEKDHADAWKKYPVFYFDFNGENFQAETGLDNIIDEHLKRWEAEYMPGEHPSGTLGSRFRTLLIKAYEQTGLRSVVLVDEYDKPLLDVMNNNALEEHNKAVFKGFFSSLKGFDEQIRFVMITGVTKFEKVSIFSDLNQLEDISLDEEYAGICGITDDEIEDCFLPEIERMAQQRGITPEICREMLRSKYDGYHFSANMNFAVYNPYSLLSALKKSRFGSYWFESGTPSFLVKRLKDKGFDLRKLSDRTIYATELALSEYRADDTDFIPLLYQTGYLTIVEYDEKNNIYTLGFPNDEVKYAFLESLVPEYLIDSGTGTGKDILTLRRYIESGDLEGIRNVFTALFASIPYVTNDPPFEHYFQTVFYLVFTLLKQFTSCETHTWQGRIDCILETDDYVYLFEFKVDDTADAALQQIEDKGYALPYAADQRTIYKVGASFDSKKRMLDDWKVVE